MMALSLCYAASKDRGVGEQLNAGHMREAREGRHGKGTTALILIIWPCTASIMFISPFTALMKVPAVQLGTLGK